MAADNPNVIMRPPLLYAGTLVLAALLDLARPLPLIADHDARFIACGVLAIAGLALLVVAAMAFRRAGTNVETTKPSTTVVEAGPYRYSRNPIYLSLTAIYLAVGVGIDTGWALVLLVPLLVVLRYGVVAREEAYLEGKFGAAYLDYKARVRRWL